MDVKFEHISNAGVITIERCDALNAVSEAMVHAIHKQLLSWETDSAINHVVIRSNCEKAFSAGGDLREVYDKRDDVDSSLAFFKAEYQLNAYIKRYPKPYIALIDGIVMGGGVGISLHGSHRVMGDNVMFAMPEVSIGFFPDIGGSYFLSRLNGGGAFGAGLYLGLSGARLGQGDCYLAGLSTHSCPSALFGKLYEALTHEACFDIDEVLADFNFEVEADSLVENHQKIIKIFSKPTLNDVMQALQADKSEWAQKLYGRMSGYSPTSLNVAFQQIRQGANCTMAQAMAMEYAIACKLLLENDFYEGIYKVLIDKTHKPNWQPSNLKDVDLDEIDGYFATKISAAEFE